MGAKRVEYAIVGRYMDGKEVVGYHLQSLDTGKAGRYTREQVVFLVGRGQVSNCSGQIYGDKVLLRGEGVSLDDLPVQQENGKLSRTDNIGKVRRGATASDAMTQVLVVALLVNGRNTWGYVIQNAGGAKTKVPKETLKKLAKEGRVGNARVQSYTNKETGSTQIILKGVDCDLTALPKYKVDANGELVKE